MVSRQVHNLKVAGSTPAPATLIIARLAGLKTKRRLSGRDSRELCITTNLGGHRPFETENSCGRSLIQKKRGRDAAPDFMPPPVSGGVIRLVANGYDRHDLHRDHTEWWPENRMWPLRPKKRLHHHSDRPPVADGGKISFLSSSDVPRRRVSAGRCFDKLSGYDRDRNDPHVSAGSPCACAHVFYSGACL